MKSPVRSRSVWMDVAVAPGAKPLAGDATTDVLVIGAGMAGLSIAYELIERGRSVILLDRGPICGGMTARTTAHLAPICDDSLSELISMRGETIARGFQESQAAAVDRIEAIQAREGIACEFRRVEGVLFLAPGDDEQTLRDEYEAAGKLDAPARLDQGLPFAGLEESPCLRYQAQATFHPLKYLAGVAAAIERKGGRLHPQSGVVELSEDDNGVVAKLDNGSSVRASFAVVATNAPINDRVALHSKQAPYRTYAMAFAIAQGALPDALYWDTADPYHYVRLTGGAEGEQILIVGGEDHKTGEANDADQRFAALEAWIRGLLPSLGEEKHRWSGQVMDTLDYCGHIGLNPGSRNIFVTTGDSGQGITHGAVASLIIPELIGGARSSWAEVYEPTRKPIKALGTYISENVTAITSMAKHLAAGEIASVEELRPGEGAVVRRGLQKIAAFRDEDGTLYERSAVCTHLGCHLQWNAFERTWDCPCHGSHFAPDGSPLNGPAIFPLAAAEETASEDARKRA